MTDNGSARAARISFIRVLHSAKQQHEVVSQ